MEKKYTSSQLRYKNQNDWISSKSKPVSWKYLLHFIVDVNVDVIRIIAIVILPLSAMIKQLSTVEDTCYIEGTICSISLLWKFFLTDETSHLKNLRCCYIRSGVPHGFSLIGLVAIYIGEEPPFFLLPIPLSNLSLILASLVWLLKSFLLEATIFISLCENGIEIL